MDPTPSTSQLEARPAAAPAAGPIAAPPLAQPHDSNMSATMRHAEPVNPSGPSLSSSGGGTDLAASSSNTSAGRRGEPSTSSSPTQPLRRLSSSPTTSGKRRSPKRLSATEPSEDRSTPACLRSIESCTDAITSWTEDFQRKEQERIEARRAKEDEDGDKPDPAWKRKGMIPLVAIILGWVYVVYVWRICVPAIQQPPPPSSLTHPRPLASRSTGIALIVVFHVVYLLTIWSYIKVVLTGPGLVRDHVEKEEQPKPPGLESRSREQQQRRETQQQWREQGLGGPYLGEEKKEAPAGEQGPTSDENASTIALRGDQDGYHGSRGEGPGDEHLEDPTLPAILGPIGAGFAAAAGEDERALSEAEQTRTRAPAVQRPPPESAPLPPIAPTQYPRSYPQHPFSDPEEQPPTRQPPFPDYAPLRRSNRYCHRCSHVKPYRAHHCRHCGTCIEKMDHHCPWVGGCVGGGNHKFYLNFVLWVTVLEFFVLISAGVLFNRGVDKSIEGWTVDGFIISLFPICVVFILFTFSLLVTHTWLIMTNQTTLDHLNFTRVARREEIALASWFSRKGGWVKQQDRIREQERAAVAGDLESQGVGEKGSSSAGGRAGAKRTEGFRMIKEQRQTKKAWDREWGRLRYEINLWKVERALPASTSTPASVDDSSSLVRYRKLSGLQSLHANWTQTMGFNPLGWLLPIGRPGLDPSRKSKDGGWETYPVNPRFGHEGQWRRRNEWPEEMR
ncbi:hypothetical protein BCV69DRAFT_315115 [Microstroma glucosiphilum]|uniref:Palmitoyltransferase n=1 Tax=Pseudomicrostroma glucosiphilum TaxID=1684307 RepID=A0A316U4W1_9BASI|nr:hypothetical protein BCV69DRAFT_315115 [Pseudomicrostroma glucosiphilum]PWN17995.1 hypothetical protein BCV69DRAFT_315115 [Pseudomicrostroma glucosiphilum]